MTNSNNTVIKFAPEVLEHLAECAYTAEEAREHLDLNKKVIQDLVSSHAGEPPLVDNNLYA